MKTVIKLNDKGKYKVYKMNLATIKIVRDALESYLLTLFTLKETLDRHEHHKDYSICAVLLYNLDQKLNKRGLPVEFSFTVELYELFILYEALHQAQFDADDYCKSISTQLVMMIYALLPIKKQPSINRTTTA